METLRTESDRKSDNELRQQLEALKKVLHEKNNTHQIQLNMVIKTAEDKCRDIHSKYRDMANELHTAWANKYDKLETENNRVIDKLKKENEKLLDTLTFMQKQRETKQQTHNLKINDPDELKDDENTENNKEQTPITKSPTDLSAFAIQTLKESLGVQSPQASQIGSTISNEMKKHKKKSKNVHIEAYVD